MNKKSVFSVLAVIALLASLGMYFMAKNSPNLSELKDFWWIPIPIAVICFLIAGSTKKAS